MSVFLWSFHEATMARMIDVTILKLDSREKTSTGRE